MNKLLWNLLVVFFLGNTGFILADQGTLEIRSSAFIPSSHYFRELYEDVRPTVAIEASNKFCGCYSAWIDIDFFTESKRQSSCCKSKIDIYNSSFGINYFIPITCSAEAYVGIGPSFSRVNIKNHTCCRKEHLSRFVVGGIVKTGVCFYLCDPFYLNVFADYLYQPIHFHRTVDIGGIKAGIGFGIRL